MSYTAVTTVDALLRTLVAWLVQSYPQARVPSGLILRSLERGLNIPAPQSEAAIREALARRLLQQHGISSDGIVVSLTPLGIEQGHALIAAVQAQLGSGRLTRAATTVVESMTAAFRETLVRTATEWAKAASSDVEPIHVVMAARALAAGALVEAIDAYDATRDKTADGPAERKLLELLFRQTGRGSS